MNRTTEPTENRARPVQYGVIFKEQAVSLLEEAWSFDHAESMDTVTLGDANVSAWVAQAGMSHESR